jgi:hypothetical protein
VSLSNPGLRDGSGFRFDHLAGQYAGVENEISADRYPSWLRCRFCAASSVAGVAKAIGEDPTAFSLLCLVRLSWSLRRSVSQNPTILGTSDD